MSLIITVYIHKNYYDNYTTYHAALILWEFAAAIHSEHLIGDV